MAYAKVGPFADGVGPYLSAATFNTIENGIAAAATKADAAWPASGRGFVTPYDYGALGGAADDTAAVQAALDSGQAVLLPGAFNVTGVTNTKGNALIGYGPQHSRLTALAGTATIYTAKQLANQHIEGVWFDGKGVAATCVDTSWDIGAGAAQSLCSVFKNVRVSNYTTTGWQAAWNNDCEFGAVLIDKSGTAVGLSLLASGGGVELHDCKIYGLVKLACQSATISACVLNGVEVDGADTNALSFDGGYYYTSPLNASIVYVAPGANMQCAPTFTGCNLIVNIDGGNVIGTSSSGAGTMGMGALILGGLIVAAGTGSATKSITRSTLICPAGNGVTITLMNVLINGVSITANIPANCTIKTSHCVASGAVANSGL